MAKTSSKQSLILELKHHFPDRWEISRLQGKISGGVASGAIKIHCNEDDKTFLTDFVAKLDSKGKILDLELDGVKVGKFIGRRHQGTGQ